MTPFASNGINRQHTKGIAGERSHKLICLCSGLLNFWNCNSFYIFTNTTAFPPPHNERFFLTELLYSLGTFERNGKTLSKNVRRLKNQDYSLPSIEYIKNNIPYLKL